MLAGVGRLSSALRVTGQNYCRFSCARQMGESARVLAGLRTGMARLTEPLTAYIVPSGDSHNSEYLAGCDERRAAVSGFTGSAGTAIVTATEALVWTDGRYHLQARQEMSEAWTLMKDGLVETPSQAEWLAGLGAGARVGCDPHLMGVTAWTGLADKLGKAGLALVPVQENLVDRAWEERPARPASQVFPLELQFTGERWEEKVGRVRAMLQECGAAALLLTALDEVAWLFNLRGSDIDYNPVFFSYAVVTQDRAVLFLRAEQASQQVVQALAGRQGGQV